jgi:hypothetical protein
MSHRRTAVDTLKRGKYEVRGSVRGVIYRGNSLTAALKKIKNDRIGCKRQGGYSDVHLYENGAPLPVSTDDDGRLVVGSY